MRVVDGVEMLEVRAAAAYVGRSPETLRRWVWSGRVTSIRQGNRLLIARTELDSAMQQAGVGTAPPHSPAMSLGAWAAAVPRRADSGDRAEPSTTAADLIGGDRWSDDHGR